MAALSKRAGFTGAACALLLLARVAPARASAPHAAAVSRCSAPCITRLSGFGSMRFPTDRLDLAFHAPREFTVVWSFSRCSRPDPHFVLFLWTWYHGRYQYVRPVHEMAGQGAGVATVDHPSRLVWEPQVHSTCHWLITVRRPSR